MLLLKIAASALMVITITGVAERISPRFAGVLLGFPLGVGLSLFFIGVEQGTRFAAGSALWSIQGITASLMFCLGYRMTASSLLDNPRRGILPAIGTGLAAYFSSAYLLMHLPADSLTLRYILVVLVLIITALIFRSGQIEQPLAKIRITPLMIGCRALTAALIVVLITETAGLVGPQWSGLFSAFPTTILPAVVILQYHYGPKVVAPLFRELPLGMPAIIVFALGVNFFFPLSGVYLGTLLAYATAGLYLLLYELVLRSRINISLDQILMGIQHYLPRRS